MHVCLLCGDPAMPAAPLTRYAMRASGERAFKGALRTYRQAVKS